MAKAKYICKYYDRSNDCMCLTYSYRGYEYDVYENCSKGSEPLRWQHANAQARIDRRIEIEQMASHSDQGMSFDESLEYFFQNVRRRRRMSKIIENIDDIKLLINKYEWLKDRAIDMIDDDDFDEIQNLEWSDDDLTIYYSTYCYGCYEYNITLTVPISWFLLNDEDLKKS